jgi:hypothetical protein
MKQTIYTSKILAVYILVCLALGVSALLPLVSCTTTGNGETEDNTVYEGGRHQPQ